MTNTLSAVTNLQKVVGAIRKQAPDLMLQHVQVLLEVYLAEGRTVTAVQEACDMTNSAGSRVIRTLATQAGGGREGLGYLRVEANPLNLRERIVSLTPEGREVVSRLLQATYNNTASSS